MDQSKDSPELFVDISVVKFVDQIYNLCMSTMFANGTKHSNVYIKYNASLLIAPLTTDYRLLTTLSNECDPFLSLSLSLAIHPLPSLRR